MGTPIDELDALIDRSGLKELLKHDGSKPIREFEVEESGKNLSAGEKQLVCICRAALRNAKVVLFDEATANIDVLTEHKILDLIKEQFAKATVLTIAHRLNTIINSDMIAVLGYGKLLEYGAPTELLKNPQSEFTKLI